MVRGNAIRQIKPTQIQSFVIEVESNIISQNCFELFSSKCNSVLLY
jgi:hypothetical protein